MLIIGYSVLLRRRLGRTLPVSQRAWVPSPRLMMVAFNLIASKVWEGRFLRTGSAGDAAEVKTFETALGLNQAASLASQPGPAAAADKPPAADGGGGGGTDAAGPPAADGCGRGGAGTDAQVIKLTRKISAMEAQISELEQGNGILEESIQILNSKLANSNSNSN